MNQLKYDLNDWLLSNYWYFFLGVIVLEITLYQFVFPKEKIVLSTPLANKLTFNYIKDKEIHEEIEIIKMKYWWNYSFKDSARNEYEVNWNKDKTGLGSKGPANGYWIYLKLITNSNNSILLYEELGNWSEQPNWDYSIESGQNSEKIYKCFDIQKIVKSLKEASITGTKNHNL